MTKSFTIEGRQISDVMRGRLFGVYYYTGAAIRPLDSLLAGSGLVNGSDYSVSYANNVNAGTASCTLVGKGNYTGTHKGTFTISSVLLSWNSGDYAGGAYSVTYTGQAIRPPVRFYTGSSAAAGREIPASSYAKYGLSYSYESNVNAGTAYINIKIENQNYQIMNNRRMSFKINKAGNPAVVKKATKTVSYSKLKKAAQTVGGVVTVSGAQGQVAYVKASGSSALSINKQTGKVTAKKGTKKGTYSMRVQVAAAGGVNYLPFNAVATAYVKVV